MPRPQLVPDEQVLDRLASVFRETGFGAALIGDLSDATGLQRASLYHRYPGGKLEMAQAVLTRIGGHFASILAPLHDDPDVAHGIGEAGRGIKDFYAAGTLSCVLDTIALRGSPPELRTQAAAMAQAWIDAMTHAARRGGHSELDAARAARDAFVRIEGALVLARVTGDTAAFEETVDDLPRLLLPRP